MRREASLLLLGLSIYRAIRFISHSLNGNQPVAVDDSSQDDVNLTQTVSPPATKYDVFLSFRGEDTRHKFANYLYKGLHDAGILTFMDHELIKGEQISEILLRKIEESKISVIIFSENYASSTWCLDELVHILECKKNFGRDVIPIFYNVDPSNIRKQNGSFGKGFNVLERRFKDKEKLQKWRDALKQSAELCGWHSNSTSCDRPEFKLIEDIVKDILSKLNYKSSYHLEGLVGIAHHIRNIENLLIEARIVGIWGMGGSGKTTLAKAIFQVLRAQFDASSFVDVKEQLKKFGLVKLQQKCLKELLKDKNIGMHDINSSSVLNRLGRKKILIIFDDVDDAIKVEDLTKVLYWCGEGSRIIITSRDMQVLQNAYEEIKPRSAQEPYHVSELDFHDAIHLFSLKAFKQHEPSEGYMELSKLAVKYCQGNPLALVVLGCSLYRREKVGWESSLEELDKNPPKGVVDVLKLSFDGLNGKQQNVFLDLAFLINVRVDISLNLRQLYDYFAPIDISVLREKSLISFDHHDCVVMHDLMMKMGLEIARQQLLLANPGTLVRLWKYEDIDYFFSSGKGMEAIRCMSLDMSKIQEITLEASSFRKMHNLIFLKIYKSDRRWPPMLNICGDLNYLPKELRFLSWEECPLSFVPLHICANNLVALDMPNSNIQQLWNGNQHFPNLERIDLSHSKHLTTMPDLSYAPKIKNLNLNGCVNLAQIHSSTYPGKDGNVVRIIKVRIDDCGPMQIKFGGSMKGRSSGFVIVSSVFDLEKLSLYKMTMKVFACGNMICGVRLKHEVMPLEEKKELRKVVQSLGFLLPFVREVNGVEGPIEFGHDFNQHYDYFHYYPVTSKNRRTLKNWRNDDKEDDMLMNEHSQVVTMSLMEEDEEDDVLMEDCCSKSVTFIRVPNSITRWSLLTQLALKSQSLPLSNDDYCRRMKLHLDVTYSFPDITPSADPLWTWLDIYYVIKQRGFTYPYPGLCTFTCCWYPRYNSSEALDFFWHNFEGDKHFSANIYRKQG